MAVSIFGAGLAGCARLGWQGQIFAKLGGPELDIQSMPALLLGGSDRDIKFNVTTASGKRVDALKVQFSQDGGKSWKDQLVLPPDSRKFKWQVPAGKDIARAKLQIVAGDTRGDTALAQSNDFGIRKGPPAFTLVHPVRPEVSSKRELVFDGACEDGLPVFFNVDGKEQPSLKCASGKWSYSAKVSSDGKRLYEFSQSAGEGITTTVSQVWISDATAPSFDSFSVKWRTKVPGQLFTVTVSLKAKDALTGVTDFCVKLLEHPEKSKPISEDLGGCWKPLSKTGENTAEIAEFQFDVPYSHQSDYLYAWIQDGARNVGEATSDPKACEAWQGSLNVVGPSQSGQNYQWIVLNARDFKSLQYQVGSGAKQALLPGGVAEAVVTQPTHVKVTFYAVDSCGQTRSVERPLDVDQVPNPQVSPVPTDPPVCPPSGTPQPAPPAITLPAQGQPHLPARFCGGHPALEGDCNGNGKIDSETVQEIGSIADRLAGRIQCASGLKAWDYDFLSPARESWRTENNLPGFKCLAIQCIPTGAYTTDGTGAACCSGIVDASARCLDVRP